MCATLQRNAAAANRFGTLDEYIDYLEDTSGTAATARSSAVTGLALGLTGLPTKQILPVLLRRRTRGDLDSTAAIYGALAGTFHPDSLPTSWTTRIDQYYGRSLHDTADQLHRNPLRSNAPSSASSADIAGLLVAIRGVRRRSIRVVVGFLRR